MTGIRKHNLSISEPCQIKPNSKMGASDKLAVTTPCLEEAADRRRKECQRLKPKRELNMRQAVSAAPRDGDTEESVLL